MKQAPMRRPTTQATEIGLLLALFALFAQMGSVGNSANSANSANRTGSRSAAGKRQTEGGPPSEKEAPAWRGGRSNRLFRPMAAMAFSGAWRDAVRR